MAQPAVTATDPPVRGDHRTTWRTLAIAAALFLTSVAAAIAIAGARP